MRACAAAVSKLAVSPRFIRQPFERPAVGCHDAPLGKLRYAEHLSCLQPEFEAAFASFCAQRNDGFRAVFCDPREESSVIDAAVSVCAYSAARYGDRAVDGLVRVRMRRRSVHSVDLFKRASQCIDLRFAPRRVAAQRGKRGLHRFEREGRQINGRERRKRFVKLI